MDQTEWLVGAAVDPAMFPPTLDSIVIGSVKPAGDGLGGSGDARLIPTLDGLGPLDTLTHGPEENGGRFQASCGGRHSWRSFRKRGMNDF